MVNASIALQWRQNGHDGVSNQQPYDRLLNRLFRRRPKTSKLRVTGLCAGNSPVTGEFPAQGASNTENISIWWRHRDQYMRQYTRPSLVQGRLQAIIGTNDDLFLIAPLSPNVPTFTQRKEIAVWKIRANLSVPPYVATHLDCSMVNVCPHVAWDWGVFAWNR